MYIIISNHTKKQYRIANNIFLVEEQMWANLGHFGHFGMSESDDDFDWQLLGESLLQMGKKSLEQIHWIWKIKSWSKNM